MTGPEHYYMAESCLEAAIEADDRGSHEAASRLVHQATTHALLANAAAQALQHTQRDGWEKVAG